MWTHAASLETAAAMLAAASLAAFAACYLGTGVVVRLLHRWSIFDHPTTRSSHRHPTPRGGGLAVVVVVLAAWILVALAAQPIDRAALIACAVAVPLAAVSWLDDVRGLGAGIRLVVQIVAVAAVMILAPPEGAVFGGLLPAALDHAAAALLWLWFINAFNFMDGIDGIAASETAAIGVGVAAVAAVAGLAGVGASSAEATAVAAAAQCLVPMGALVAAAALGFLPWNWHPARVFLGDVGSIALGFLLGWLLLRLAALGEPAAALILPLFYLVDATTTLIRRLLRGEKPWRAHREHFYQKPVARGLAHSVVTTRVCAANAGLVALAVAAALGYVAAALAGACLIVASLIMFLASARGRRARVRDAD